MTRTNAYFSGRLKIVGAVCICAAVLSGCSLTGQVSRGQGSANPEPSIKSVAVMEVAKMKIGEPVEVIAEVRPSVQMKVSAPVSGSVEQIAKRRGDSVAEGEVLIRIRSLELERQKERAAIALQEAEDNLRRMKREHSSIVTRMSRSVAEATKNVNKLKNDYDLGLVSKSQLEQAQSGLKNAQSDLDFTRQQQRANIAIAEETINEARTSLQEAGAALGQLEVKAPTDGVLTDLPLTVGAPVQAGSQIGLIEKVDPVVIMAELSEEAVAFVRGKTELSYLAADNELPAKGEISYLATVADPMTNTYELSLEVPNIDMRLKPGMKVRLRLTDESEQIVTAIPTRSIVQDGENAYVFVVKNDAVQKRNVQLGRLNEPIQEVLGGLDEGELLVISGHNQLSENETVRWTTVQSQY